ncbi:MAG: 3-hydroxyacyl-CoA dehydrogenase/enoyl-CoA hydratase/3-hydroxybutyryl-CoA epimerase [Gammaproteobacteria bacterium]|jgi:3-hydroxyacyl-CoA dehydrogenase/enoyl-CoA hydratase/3-hydroxybutyryl-CoA epimerase
MSNVFQYDKDSDGIVTITMDMTGPVNSMNEEFQPAIAETVERLEAEEGLTGVVWASAKKTFFAGGNLRSMLEIQPGEDVAEFKQALTKTKALFARVEALQVPRAVAINGAALGGGYELALLNHHLVAWNKPSVEVGTPEVSLGLLPGGGGVVRLVNLLGLEKAIPHLVKGTRHRPEAALELGLVHQLVDELDQLIPACKSWIKANPDVWERPWQKRGHRVPGGNPFNNPKLAQFVMGTQAMINKQTKGLLPAPQKILEAAVEASIVDFDSAQRFETNALSSLVATVEAKNTITSGFFQLAQLNKGASRPQGIEPSSVQRLGIIGAGMMGQGIAYVAAKAGIEVVLKDISQTGADKGKAYSAMLCDKQIKRGRMDEAGKQAFLSKIKASDQATDLASCDLIVEAVFEDVELKHNVTKEMEPQLAENGVWGSNTSTLPISMLAAGSSKPANFIGIHFFSPVDKMPLVEIICGADTSDETLARAFDFVKQIRKIPIVVNDFLGFFTSRVYGTALDEAARMVIEGIHPAIIENAGIAYGMPTGPLAAADEVSQKLAVTVLATHKKLGLLPADAAPEGTAYLAGVLVDEYDRAGRHHGGGYYEYPAEGGKKYIWPTLIERFHNADTSITFGDVKDRMLFRSVIESLKCLEEGVLRTVVDGNIGSMFGIGAPPWTGGYIQFVNTYGMQRFVDRCNELASLYGERFTPPAIVVERAETGEWFE